MSRTGLGWVAGALVVVALGAVQLNQWSQIKAELAALRAEMRGTQEAEQVAPGDSPRPITIDRTSGLHARLASLEQTVATLAKSSESLMDRGMVPPSEERLAQLRQRFFDPTASEADRIRSLRLLKRDQRQLSDQIISQAVAMMQSSTNGNTRRQLLQQLDGVTNSALKQPLLAMLNTESAGNMREELVDVLSDFAGDPAVEGKLWELAMNDPDGDVREEAQDALADGPVTPERIQNLKQRASSEEASLDERLLSLRALEEANVEASEVVSALANLAQNSTDPLIRAKLFSAFDGINDPNLMGPLVNGLQDPNPVVRENAADALSSFGSDPRIQEWLNHVIQTDADPRVKREAHSALEQSQRRNRRDR